MAKTDEKEGPVVDVVETAAKTVAARKAETNAGYPSVPQHEGVDPLTAGPKVANIEPDNKA